MPLGKQSSTEERKGSSLKLMSLMLLSTITKTWLRWIPWTKISASTGLLSVLRKARCYCSCSCLMLPYKMIGFFTGSQMQVSQGHLLCWVSEKKLSIFSAENTRLQQLGVGFVWRQILVASRKLDKVPKPVCFDEQGNYPASNLLQRRCVYCGMKFKFISEEYNIWLQIACFSAHHKKQ